MPFSQHKIVLACIMPLLLALVPVGISATEPPPLDPTRAGQKLPTEPTAASKDHQGADKPQPSDVRLVILRPEAGGAGTGKTGGDEERKDEKGDGDRFWSGDIPWIIAALIAFAGGFTALLTSLNGLLTVRSAHGALRGFLRIDDVHIINGSGAEVLAFTIVNVGKSDLRGIRFVGWVRGASGKKRRIDDPMSIQQLKPKVPLTLRCKASDDLGWWNRVIWFSCGRGQAGLIAVYTDHADVVRKEVRTYHVGSGILMQRRWRTRRAFYSVG